MIKMAAARFQLRSLQYQPSPHTTGLITATAMLLLKAHVQTEG